MYGAQIVSIQEDAMYRLPGTTVNYMNGTSITPARKSRISPMVCNQTIQQRPEMHRLVGTYCTEQNALNKLTGSRGRSLFVCRSLIFHAPCSRSIVLTNHFYDSLCSSRLFFALL